MTVPAAVDGVSNVVQRIERSALDEVIEKLKSNDCVVLLGPRQVGKSDLALEITEKFPGAIYLNLHRRNDVIRLGNGEDFFAAHLHELVVLDEIQCRPDLLRALKSQIDTRRRNFDDQTGRFIVLGSASPELRQISSNTLSGCMVEYELTVIQLGEVLLRAVSSQMSEQAVTNLSEEVAPLASSVYKPNIKTINRLWLRGGFPKSYFANNNAESLRWRRAFIKTYTELNLASQELGFDGTDLRRVWELLATRQGTDFDIAKFATDLRVSQKTVEKCVNHLVRLFLVRELPPWFGNLGKRLTKRPRYYIRDSGLLHALLYLSDTEELLGHGIVGKSWEGFVIESLICAAQAAKHSFFYRDENKDEIDLVLEFPIARRWAIEIKLGRGLNLASGTVRATKKMDVERRIVVHSGPESYQARNGFEAMPLIDACRAAASA